MRQTETSDEDKLKRQNEIQRILNKYLELWNSKGAVEEIYIIENGAKKVIDNYYQILHKAIKVYLPDESKANKFKVASGTELACIYAMPLKFSDTTINYSDTKLLNARLAVFASVNILLSVEFHEAKDFTPVKQREKLNKIHLNHITWLRYYDTKKDIISVPTFLNANYWEAFLFASTTE